MSDIESRSSRDAAAAGRLWMPGLPHALAALAAAHALITSARLGQMQNLRSEAERGELDDVTAEAIHAAVEEGRSK